MKLRFITIAVNEQFFNAVRRGIADAAAAMGVEAELVGTPGVEAKAIIALARAAIEEGVDGLALNLFEAGVFAPVIAEAKARSIPVVAFNIDADRLASGNLSFIMQDFHSAGMALGRRAAKSIARGASAIVTVHDDGVGALDERLAGVQAGLAGLDIRWIRLCTGQDPECGADLLCEALARSRAPAILATGQADTEAAGLTAKRLAPQPIYVAGFDLSPGIVDLIADGFIDCAIDQQPYSQGFYPVVQLSLYLRYGLIPASLDAGAAFIDRSNVGSVARLSRDSIR